MIDRLISFDDAAVKGFFNDRNFTSDVYLNSFFSINCIYIQMKKS